MEIEYFAAGLEMEASGAVIIVMYLQELATSKAHFFTY